MSLTPLERNQKLGAVRTAICRARKEGDEDLIAFLEKKRAQLKKQK